jgi:hypothetical protein
LRHVLTVLVMSITGFGCMRNAPQYTVPPSFSIHVNNDHGAVVGLKLRVTRFKAAEFSKLSRAEQRGANLEQFVEIIAESITDKSGDAYFNLATTGHFDVQPDHPANQLDWIAINVQNDAKPVAVKLIWPTSLILQSTQLQGRIADGLLLSRNVPLKRVAITLHDLVSFDQIEATETADDGSFRFLDVQPGLYFLRVLDEGPKVTAYGWYAPDGDIAISIRKDAPRDSLPIFVSKTDCGLSYDLEENKHRYKAEACFLGGKEVSCD